MVWTALRGQRTERRQRLFRTLKLDKCNEETKGQVADESTNQTSQGSREREKEREREIEREMHRCTERRQHAFPAGCTAERADAEHGGKVSSRRRAQAKACRSGAKTKQMQKERHVMSKRSIPNSNGWLGLAHWLSFSPLPFQLVASETFSQISAGVSAVWQAMEIAESALKLWHTNRWRIEQSAKDRKAYSRLQVRGPKTQISNNRFFINLYGFGGHSS